MIMRFGVVGHLGYGLFEHGAGTTIDSFFVVGPTQRIGITWIDRIIGARRGGQRDGDVEIAIVIHQRTSEIVGGDIESWLLFQRRLKCLLCLLPFAVAFIQLS